MMTFCSIRAEKYLYKVFPTVLKITKMISFAITMDKIAKMKPN